MLDTAVKTLFPYPYKLNVGKQLATMDKREIMFFNVITQKYEIETKLFTTI